SLSATTPLALARNALQADCNFDDSHRPRRIARPTADSEAKGSRPISWILLKTARRDTFPHSATRPTLPRDSDVPASLPATSAPALPPHKPDASEQSRSVN